MAVVDERAPSCRPASLAEALGVGEVVGAAHAGAIAVAETGALELELVALRQARPGLRRPHLCLQCNRSKCQPVSRDAHYYPWTEGRTGVRVATRKTTAAMQPPADLDLCRLICFTGEEKRQSSLLLRGAVLLCSKVAHAGDRWWACSRSRSPSLHACMRINHIQVSFTMHAR